MITVSLIPKPALRMKLMMKEIWRRVNENCEEGFYQGCRNYLNSKNYVLYYLNECKLYRKL